jgi:ABC-type Na+ transport system ATPase subunit NatA
LLHRGRLLAEGTLAELQARSGQQHLSDIFLALLNDQRSEASAA